MKHLWLYPGTAWVVVRVGFALAGALMIVFAEDDPTAVVMTWQEVAWLSAATAVALLAVLGMTVCLNRRESLSFEKPQWKRNPFRLNEPLEFFHLASFHFLGAGIAAIALASWRQTTVHAIDISLFAIGAGALAGVYVAAAFFPRLFGRRLRLSRDRA